MRRNRKKKHKSNVFKFKPFSKKQLKLIYWWDHEKTSKHDMVIADGAIRSGKTIAMICSFLRWSQKIHDGEDFIIAGKSIGALKRNVVKPMLQILDAWGWSYDFNRSENYILIGSNTYYLFGANNEASQDVLQGLTAAGALADESALFPKSFIDQMIGRCSVEGAKVFMNCNPKGPYHFIKTEFIDKAKEKRIYHLHFTMEDNLSLSEKVKERFMRMFSGVFFQRYILGLWVMAEGVIYKQFADEPDKYLINSKDLNIRFQSVNIGVDFGGTESKHSFVATGITAGYKEVVVLASERHVPKDPETLNKQFISFAKKVIKDYHQVDYVYCDSAEQVLKRGMEAAAKRAKLDLRIRNAKKAEIVDRIRLTNALIAQDRLLYTEKSKTFRNAMTEAVWDAKKADLGEDVRLDNGTTDIDTLDGFEYTIERDIRRFLRE